MNNQYMYPYFDVWGEADYLSGNTCFNLEKFQRSESGKNLMNARSLMERFEDVDDPALLALWEEMGVRCEVRVTKGQKWLCFVPLEAYGKTEEKYPVLMVFRPVGLLAEAFYQYNIEQSAQGEYITMIYSDEDFDVNDVYFDMLQEVLSDFPADPTRVYTTGHSHYGELAMELTRRFHQHIAAIAQQGDSAGIILNFYGMTQEKADLMHSYDMPLINVAGTTEFNGIFPINQDAPGVPEDSPYRKSKFPMTKERRVEDWKVRLYAMRCPVPSDEVILAAGRDKAERELGFPCDRTELLYAEGSECYVGDVKNVDGKYHFRTIALENVPHTTTRLMHVLTWSFLRRFAKNLETGEVVELFDIL